MTKGVYLMLAPFRLKDGVGESKLLEASDAFERTFVSRQEGILKRLLLKGRDGSYADLVFFQSKDDADRVCKLEETSAECREFFKIMSTSDESLPDSGVLSFEHLKTYE